jgi:hypothetical protein
MGKVSTRVTRLDGGRRKKAEHGAVVIYRYPGRTPTSEELAAHFPGVADDFVFIMLPSKDKMDDDGHVIVGSGEASFDNGVWLE